MKIRNVVFVGILLVPRASLATTTYDIDLSLTCARSYDSLDISIDFAAANGGFAGSGATVSCTPNYSLNATMRFNEETSVLKAGAMSTTPISGPAVLFTCLFDSNGGAPPASNFVISLRGWESSSTTLAPSIQISRIQVH